MARRVLEGIRFLDLTTAIAGPSVGKYFAYHGAEVIKIESRRRPEIVRMFVPARFRELGLRPDTGFGVEDFNAGKLAIGLEMSLPEGRELFDRLVKISDIVLSNFSVHGFEALGLAYDHLKEVKPQIILLLLPGFGNSGPYRDYLSWGPNLEPIAGHRHLTAWPGGPPAGTGVSFPDYIGAYHASIAVLTALHYRQQTGQGQFIDMSQFEAATAVLGPSIMNYMANGVNEGAWGNRIPYAAPHGAYRCRGEDRWVAISVFTDQEWAGFCQALGSPAWTADPRFATLAGRKEHEDELDRLVEEWTIQQDAYDVMFTLQEVGVAAGVLQNSEDIIYRDRHLRARDFLLLLNHPKKGKVLRNGIALRLLGTPGSTTRGGPIVAQDNDYVFKELLGLTDAQIAELTEKKVIEPPIWEEPGVEKLREEDLLPTILR